MRWKPVRRGRPRQPVLQRHRQTVRLPRAVDREGVVPERIELRQRCPSQAALAKAGSIAGSAASPAKRAKDGDADHGRDQDQPVGLDAAGCPPAHRGRI